MTANRERPLKTSTEKLEVYLPGAPPFGSRSLRRELLARLEWPFFLP